MRYKRAMSDGTAQPKRYTVDQILHLWVTRIQGGMLTNPITKSQSGQADPADEATRAMDYVTMTRGYWQAEPVLKWHLMKRRKLCEFNPCQPGETLDYALGRMRWREYLGVPLAQLGESVYHHFRLELQIRLINEPFVVYEKPEKYVLPLAPERTRAEAKRESRHQRYYSHTAGLRHSEAAG